MDVRLVERLERIVRGGLQQLALGVVGAEQSLGRPYRLDGVVVHGDHRGRELGYPTANLSWTGTPTVPADGVYAGWLGVGDERLPAAISDGTNPTFDGQERRVESYALDRDDLDLYGLPVRVEFTERIRGQERFDDVAALVARMAVDVSRARVILSGEGRRSAGLVLDADQSHLP
jgi:riboflavin kinase/FMN adenylyltransferase